MFRAWTSLLQVYVQDLITQIIGLSFVVPAIIHLSEAVGFQGHPSFLAKWSSLTQMLDEVPS